MSSIASIALSGMNAAQTQAQVAAGNIANAQTDGYQRQDVEQTPQTDGGVSTRVVRNGKPQASLVTDIVGELQAKNAFLANLAVFKTGNAIAGALLDEKA